MTKFSTKLFLAILLSPALITPLAAMEPTPPVILESNVSESLKKAINIIQSDFKSNTEKAVGQESLSPEDKLKLQLEANALEKQAIEQSLAKAEASGKTIPVNKEISTPDTLPPQPVQTEKSKMSELMTMEQFKVCSLGHNYNINDFEFVKQTQITQAATIMKFTAASNPNYKCEFMVLSENKQDVNLKCWHGSKYNEEVSTFKLSYFFNKGYLFSQNSKTKLVFIKQITSGQSNACPSNFIPVVNNKSGDSNSQNRSDDGLAGLTF